MNAYILPVLYLTMSFLLLFGAAEYLYHYHKVRAEITRKLVHAGTGLLTLLFPIYLDSHWQVLVLSGGFLVLLMASLRLGWLPSINAISRVSHGSVLFPVAVYVCYGFYTLSGRGPILFYLPMLLLAICDPLAAFVGKRYPYGRYRIGKSQKTFSGSLAFFLAGFGLTMASFYWLPVGPGGFWKLALFSSVISLATTLIEGVSSDGTDNLTVPVGSALMLTMIL